MKKYTNAFIEAKRLFLRPLQAEDINEAYLSWLNDSETLQYRGSKAFPTSLEGLKNYIVSIPSRGDLMLAICLKESGQHIGNITLNSIHWIHRSAELSILIGEKEFWGKGYSKESIYALSRHAFLNMGLHKLWAESPNPAFNAAMKSLGWVHEGTKRQGFFLNGKFVDFDCWGLLKDEFK